MKRRFLIALIMLGLFLAAFFGATGAYGATTEDYVRINGIDVSDFNGNIDWQKVKGEGNNFALIRIGGRYFSVNADYDDTYSDSNIKANFEGTIANEIMVGGYFFSQAITVEEAEYEAVKTHEYLSECGIGPGDLDLPIFMDREYVSGTSGAGRLMAANLSIEEELAIELAFCNKLRELGYESGLYSYASFLTDNTDSSVLSNQGYPIWVAHYETNCGYDKHYDFWQYTDKGTVNGITAATDLDYWYLNKSLDANPNSNFTLDKCSIEITHIPLYSGEAITPTFTIKAGEKTLVENVDYKVINYLDNVEHGTGYAIIRGLGSYTGYRAVPFTIVSKLNAPSNVKVTPVASTGKPKVTWDAVEGADRYEVWRSIGSSEDYKKLITTKGTYVTNTSAVTGTTYSYKILAIFDYNNDANSTFSNVVSSTCTLSQPKNIKVVPVTSTGKPKITWDKVDGATKYEVWRKASTSEKYTKLTTVAGTTLTNTSATIGTLYYYKVKAICESDDNANSAFSNVVYMTCDLPQPKNIKVAPVTSTGKPKITWDKVDGATKYEVWRKASTSEKYTTLTTTAGTALTNTSATPGTLYYYKVRAIYEPNSGANSGFSNVVYMTCDLPQPKNIKVAPVTSTGKPKITWDKVDGATKYEVWRKASTSEKYTKLTTTAGTTLTNTSATPGTLYYYKVRAIYEPNSGANSGFSNVVYMTCDLSQPKASISLTTSGKPKVSWNAVSGASKYEIYRAVGSKGTYQKYYTTTNLSMTNTSATKGTTYFYKVKAICGSSSGGNSALSNQVYITSK